MKKQKLVSVISAVALAVGLLTGCGATSTEGNETTEDKVNVNVALNTSAYMALLDQELRFSDEIYKDDNVEIVYTMFENGPAILEALEGGSVDIVSVIGELPAITSKAAGRDIEAVLAVSNTNSSAVAVLEGSDIKEVADLAGKKVGVAFGTVQHYVIYKRLEEAGLSVEDVELINLSVADSYTALAAGEIDAIVIGRGESIADRVEFIGDFYYNIEYTLVRGAFAKEHPDIVSKYLAVLQTAGNYTKENPEEAAKIAAEGSGKSEESLLETFKAGVYDDILYPVSDTNLTATEGLIQFAYDYELSTAVFSVDDFFDNSYIDDAKKYVQ